MDLDGNIALLGEVLQREEPSLIVARAPCILAEKPVDPQPRRIDQDQCVACGQCVGIGCPAIECADGYPHVNELLCVGCGLCDRVCDLRLVQPAK
jgi:indolepyruvate ferredoxin oxidoreductase alpha subunit